MVQTISKQSIITKLLISTTKPKSNFNKQYTKKTTKYYQLNKLINKLKNNEFSNLFKGILTLAIGSSAARLIGFASIPIITRIYNPEDFGLLALFTSFVVILVPFATLKYSTAIPLPKTDAMAINILALGIFLIVVFLIIISIPLVFFSETILTWFNATELAKWWWLIIIAIVGSASYELFSSWSTRKRKYKIIAKTQFTQSLIGNTVKIVLGLLAIKPFGLIFGQFLSQSAGMGYLIKASFEDFKKSFSSISIQRIKIVAINYREFAYFRLPSHFLMGVSTQAPVLMMATLFDKNITGQLSLAIIATSLPTGLIGNSISQAFYAEIARLGRHNIKQIKKMTTNIQKKLFIVGIPFTLLLIFFAEPVFIFIFGKEWATAGYFSSILAPFILLQLTSAPLIQVLNITGSQLTFLIINITRLIGLSIIFLFFYNFNFESYIFVKVLSTFLSFFYLLISLFIFYSINKSVK